MANMKYQSYRVRYRATPDSEEETQHVVAPYGCDENDLAAMLKVSKSSHWSRHVLYVAPWKNLSGFSK
jgi:hypothetical protein